MPVQQNPVNESAPVPRFSLAHRVLQQAVLDRAFPGAAYGVLSGEEIVAMRSVGQFTYDADAPPVHLHTTFDMASVSKVMATTAMAMLLWQRGKLGLDRPVGETLPEFVGAERSESLKRSVTPRMLLAHSSGLPAYERLYERCPTRQSLLDACTRMPLEAAPETRAVYSDIGFIVLGHLLETLAAESLDAFCQREIFAPLGMTSTFYSPSQEMRPSIPPTGIDVGVRCGLVQGEVHDDNCWRLGGVAGHAGLFSNVADTLSFAFCILRGGAPIFKPETIALFTARQPQPPHTGRALGWDTPSASSSSGHYFSAHSVGHLGFTGTSLWIDLENHVAIVLLTNRTYPGTHAEESSAAVRRLRPLFHDAVIQELLASK